MTDTDTTTGGVYVPAHVLQISALNPSTLHTWMLLRSLSGQEGPATALTLEQISSVSGKSASTLYGHLATLKRLGLLRWRVVSLRHMLFTFDGVEDSGKPLRAGIQESGIPSKIPETGTVGGPDGGDQGNTGSGNAAADHSQVDFSDNRIEDAPESWDSENPDALPLKPLINFITQKDSGLREAPFQETGLDAGNPEIESVSDPESGDQANVSNQNAPENQTQVDFPGNRTKTAPESWDSKYPDALPLKPLINFITQKDSGLREAPFQETGLDAENLEREAVKAYRQLLGLRPNQVQRQAIKEQVRDLEAWRATLEHWLEHRWNPKNIPGMLELYGRGGSQGCRFCRRDGAGTGMSVLDKLRKEFESG